MRERVAQLAHREDRPDRDVRIARREQDQIGVGDRLEHSRRRPRRLLPLEAHGVDLVPVAARDEPLLERERPGRRLEPRPQPVVGRRQQPRRDAERRRQPSGHRGERLARAQRLRAHEMEPEIAVAEREPVLAAERADRLERVPGLAAPPPAALLVGEAGERVEDRVEIRRDVEAEHLDVVADVADHARRSRAGDVDDAADEARAAHASRKDDDVQATLLSSSARQACVRGPARNCSRVRSSIVSTSSARFGTATETTSRPSDAACARKRSELPGP